MLTAIVLVTLSASEPMAPAFFTTPWGAISGDGKTVYLRTDKGIEALDAATGKLAWTAEGKLRPVAVLGGVVMAYGQGKGPALSLVGLDATSGKQKWTKDVPMPEWVVVEGPALGRSFTARAAGGGESALLEYHARSWYAGGARPTPEIEEAARKEARGVIKIDAKTGKFEKLADGKMPAPAVHRKGDVTFTVEQGAGILLKRTKAGKRLDEVELHNKPARVSVALDGATILILGDSEGKRAAGMAFDPATGMLTGKFDASSRCEHLDAVGQLAFGFGGEGDGGRPFGTTPRTLEVISLKSGKALWSRKGESRTMLPPVP
jgi:hypothetical protein